MVEKSIHRRLVAILVADVVGYSRMMEADEVGTFEALKKRRRHVLDPVVRADGVTEDIITELSRFKDLSVVARNTTFSYKGQSVNVAEVGRQLGADFVLEGSVRLAGQRLRASVQLIDAQTGAHVFAEKFDREMADIFAVQDQIVEAIIGRLFFKIVAYAGRHEEGLALVERGCKFEPLLPPAFVSSLGDCYYLARRFDAALATYGTLINPPYFFRLNQAACLAQLGREEEAAVIARQKPDTFDATVYARNTVRICALPEDGDLWMDGFHKAGVSVSRIVL